MATMLWGNFDTGGNDDGPDFGDDRSVKRYIKAARGILPWRPGDELPEERIRRLRDGD